MKKVDNLGSGYWQLSRAQGSILGALQNDYQPLRDVLEQAGKNALSANGHIRWEKLAVLDALEVDLTRQDNVYVRRGPAWQQWWDRCGFEVTFREDIYQKVDAMITKRS
ncbi:hypothetical protein [Azospirillum argentinense]|uniref:Uncharacterized protein n=1 Tax=Azospirillum argentinense TaxID=2970906 RepID=A0A5B0KMM5_9PROT|nr:hypothetical protein [Azospirillum argentinense]KAA1053073.1 hypothetical protein FH063_002992 [Azospirillum argentinense]